MKQTLHAVASAHLSPATGTWRRGLGMALLALSAWLGAAVEAAAAPARMALVLGNAGYSVKPLSNPRNDADDVGRELGRLGFAVHKHTDLGRRALNEALRKFVAQAAGSELVMIYYSGHGLQASGENYIIPVDAQINDERDIRTEGIALRDLLADLDEAKVQRTVVVLDACRDNPYATRARSVRRGLARQEVPSNSTLVAFATSEGKTADDGTGRNGVYTTEFLNQLRRVDQDVRDVFDETAIAVARRAPDQRPKVYGDTGAFKGVYLSARASATAGMPRAPAAPTATRGTAEEEAWDEIKTSTNVSALQAFLNEFPQGVFAARVRTRLASLAPSVAAAAPQPVTPAPQPAARSRSSNSWLDR